MQGNGPGMGYGPPNPTGPATQHPVPNLPSTPLHPSTPYAALSRRSSRLAVFLATVAALLAGAALLVSLVRKPETTASVQATTAPTTMPAQQMFVDDADRALCQDIGPLMREGDDQTRSFGQYARASPEQAAALPNFRAFTEDWANRMQTVLNRHTDPPRYLTRTLQRFIDDMVLYVERDNVSDEVGVWTFRLSSTDYSGPQFRCQKLGAAW